MAQQLDQSETVTFKELLMSNAIQVDAVAQLLIEKGVFTVQEFSAKLKEVQYAYEVRKSAEV
jgi:beta-N-acetylglucosaminidase